MTSLLSTRKFQKRRMIPYIQIEKVVLTIFDCIVNTTKTITYSFELFKNRILIIKKAFQENKM